LLTTDQYHFIVDYKVMEAEKDARQITALKERIKPNYRGKKIASHSFDKGFYSKENLTALQQDYTEQAILSASGGAE